MKMEKESEEIVSNQNEPHIICAFWDPVLIRICVLPKGHPGPHEHTLASSKFHKADRQGDLF